MNRALVEISWNFLKTSNFSQKLKDFAFKTQVIGNSIAPSRMTLKKPVGFLFLIILPFAKQSSCAVIAFMLNKGLHGGNALDLSCYLSVTYALGKPCISISLLDKKVMLHNKSTKCSLSTNKVMMQYYYCCYQLLGTICDQMLPGVTKSNQVSPDRIV